MNRRWLPKSAEKLVKEVGVSPECVVLAFTGNPLVMYWLWWSGLFRSFTYPVALCGWSDRIEVWDLNDWNTTVLNCSIVFKNPIIKIEREGWIFYDKVIINGLRFHVEVSCRSLLRNLIRVSGNVAAGSSVILFSHNKKWASTIDGFWRWSNMVILGIVIASILGIVIASILGYIILSILSK